MSPIHMESFKENLIIRGTRKQATQSLEYLLLDFILQKKTEVLCLKGS